MISHVVLYRFPADIDAATRAGFIHNLQAASAKTGVVQRFTFGPHVPLPADRHATQAMFSMAAIWEFAELADLHSFSEHPVMGGFVDEWVRELHIGVAFANYTPDAVATTAADL